MARDVDPQDIIEEYHQKRKEAPKICKRCGKDEMKKEGKRMSASVNYMVWRCKTCGNEDMEFMGLSEDTKELF